MAEQFKVAIPYEERVNGWLYDFDSGVCMGIASDEMRKKYPNGDKVPFSMMIAGCPHKLVIHTGAIKVVTDPTAIFEWRYTRSKGDIEVFAPTKDEAARLVKETGLVKRFDATRLHQTSGVLADRLKKESIK